MFFALIGVLAALLVGTYAMLDLYSKLCKELPELKDVAEAVFWEGWAALTIAVLPFAGLMFQILDMPLAAFVVLVTAAPLTAFAVWANARSAHKYEERILNILPSHKRTLKRLLYLPTVALPSIYAIGVLLNVCVTVYPLLHDPTLLGVILLICVLALPIALIYIGCFGALNYILSLIHI